MGRAGSTRPAGPTGTPVHDDSDPTPLFTATEYVAVGDSPLYQVVAELIAVGDGGQSAGAGPVDAAPTASVEDYPADAVTAGLPLDVLEPPIAPRRVRIVQAATSPALSPALSPAPSLPEASYRSSDLDSVTTREPHSEGGRHRDELRLAGHRSAFDDGRRSTRRSPRHRTV